MSRDDESQSAEDQTRELTSTELELIAELDALDITSPIESVPAPVSAPTPSAQAIPASLDAARAWKTDLEAAREARLETLREEKRASDNLAYANLIMKTKLRPVRSYQPITPERKKEKELTKYRSKPTSEQSRKRAERRRRAKNGPVAEALPEGFGKF